MGWRGGSGVDVWKCVELEGSSGEKCGGQNTKDLCALL